VLNHSPPQPFFFGQKSMEENITRKSKQNCLSWKTILKFCSEFPDDEWFTIKEFRRLYGTTRCRTQQQFKTFVSWSFLRRKRIDKIPGVRRSRAYLYQITPAGRLKTEYIVKQAELDMQFYSQANVKITQ